MYTPLEQSILATVAYFDVFSYPLTGDEIYRWLWKPPPAVDPRTCDDSLQTLLQNGYIGYAHGYYFLSGNDSHVERRNLSVPLIEEKLQIARRAVKKIQMLPFLRAVYVCNTVASSAVRKESDIDVFIVVQSGRLWLTRFLISGVLSLFRLRRTNTCVPNKICLSFYTTTGHRDLSDVTIDGEDVYLMYWIDQGIPLYVREKEEQTFLQENAWVRDALPHALRSYVSTSRYACEEQFFSKMVQRAGEFLLRGRGGSFLEQRLRKMQKARMDTNYASVQHADDSRVVIDDTMLKFHENDRRAQYRAAWQERCTALGLTNI